jgi:valyl-tRNA synthetase
MIMTGMYFMKEIPFSDVYIYATVLDEHGKRQSKSLGTGVDPLDVIKLYGTDALRFALLVRAARGQDIRFASIEYDKDKNPVRQRQVEEARNFANKIWNAARFVMMNLGEASKVEAKWVPSDELADRWILAELNSAIEQTTRAFDEYKLNEVAQTLYHFFWDDFCDWYIELSKSLVAAREETPEVLAARCRIVYILEASLRLLHPLMPYITEEIWQRLPHAGESIMLQAWPTAEAARDDERARERMGTLIALITKVRNIRSIFNIPSQSRIELHIGSGDEAARSLVSENSDRIKRLARVDQIVISDTLPALESAASDIVSGIEIAVPLGGLIDLDKESERLSKEMERKHNEARGLASRLDNASFVERAPSDVVQETQRRHEELIAEIDKLRATLISIGRG